jgi:transcriptional regulator with GAF, ATPase, and Fis domain
MDRRTAGRNSVFDEWVNAQGKPEAEALVNALNEYGSVWDVAVNEIECMPSAVYYHIQRLGIERVGDQWKVKLHDN